MGDVETVSALKPTGHALLAYPIEEVDALTLDLLRKYLRATTTNSARTDPVNERDGESTPTDDDGPADDDVQRLAEYIP